MTCPSVEGVKPRLAAEIAFSTAWIIGTVPDLNAQQTRLRHVDGCKLVERHVVAIGIDLQMVEQRRLDKFVRWPESSLERSERLEQLRFLEYGIPLYVAETPFDTVGVDTEEDLRRVEEILKKNL